ncbi:MAG: hypothetical protein ACKVW3_06530 [Phycisphaerales bacterium]
MRVRLWHVVCVAAASGAATDGARAQEAMYTEAATMPSPGTFVLRQQFHVFRFGMNGDAGISETTQYEAMTTVDYGLVRDVSLRLDVPLVYRDEDLVGGGSDSDRGVEDLDLMVKYRFYKSDTGGVNTVRAAVFGGFAFASGDDHDFSSQTVNPQFGAVVTMVQGRHGFNQELSVRINTGGDDEHNFGGDGRSDAIFHNTAYLYRLAPARYTKETVGAWYGTAEAVGIYETNGDYELRGSLGVMYEGRTWGFEAMVLLPLYEALDDRAELDWGVGFGFRFAF